MHTKLLVGKLMLKVMSDLIVKIVSADYVGS